MPVHRGVGAALTLALNSKDLSDRDKLGFRRKRVEFFEEFGTLPQLRVAEEELEIAEKALLAAEKKQARQQEKEQERELQEQQEKEEQEQEEQEQKAKKGGKKRSKVKMDPTPPPLPEKQEENAGGWTEVDFWNLGVCSRLECALQLRWMRLTQCSPGILTIRCLPCPYSGGRCPAADADRLPQVRLGPVCRHSD